MSCFIQGKMQLIKSMISISAQQLPINRMTGDNDTRLKSQPNWIGCSNGVYDLSTQQFHEGQFTRVSTNTPYQVGDTDGQYDTNHPLVKELMCFLTQLQPIESERNRLLDGLRSCLNNRRELVFQGIGSNGKTSLIQLLKLTLGDLVYCPPHGTFPHPRSVVESMIDSNIVILDECSANSLHIAKSLLYRDKITYRPLFEKYSKSITPQFSVIVATSQPHKLRCPLYSFETQFVNEEDNRAEANGGNGVTTKQCGDPYISKRFESWRRPFLHLLLNFDTW